MKNVYYYTTEFFLSFFLVVVFGANGVAVAATRCECKQFPTNAEGNGTCSRTEDKKRCTLSFSATAEDEYKKFVSRLNQLKLDVEPRTALRLSFEIPPEKWSGIQFGDLLPVLHAISQKDHFQEVTPLLVDAYNELKKRPLDYERIWNAFSKNLKETYRTKSSDFEWIVSYGCIELKKGDLSTMVKTRWSPRRAFCDDIRFDR